jgi:starch-binding outer membrane protein, SusD/RagB family
MKKKYIYATLLALSTSVFTACDKEKLDFVPADRAVAETSFSTPVRILAGVNGLYSTMRSAQFLGGRFQIYNDIRGEDFTIETSNLVTGADVYQLNLANSATAVKGLWSQAYLTINRCNVFIDGMTASGIATINNPTVSNGYIAEARFLRALSYYSLLQLYAKPYADNNGNNPGLPLRITGNTSAGNYDLARSTVAQVYAQIIEDLNFAETNLLSNNGTASLNTIRAHKNTAIALKTRVYLSMQRYGDVITEANKIVPTTGGTSNLYTATSGVPNALQADITNVFKTPYTTTESVFSMPWLNPNEVPGTQNQLAYYFYQSGGTPGVGEYAVNPTGVLSNPQWTATDRRRTSLLFNTSNGKSWVFKYPTTGLGGFADYAPVMRWSEVLLNLAEARARGGAATGVADVQGLALLNAVHTRSDAGKPVVAATNADLINAILIERRIEFIGEGIRNFDIMRLRQTIPAKTGAPQKAPGDQGYIWPISSDEIALNKLITDNN